ncbi:hypothetical protein CCUS01_11468 [Colletotrichum cuscutae]|uniref:Uncharacterized protein n=1 Tax=Colletotrichum cuscutae TaxID=1209917 RepID=A0AAI9U0U5_9PEZI|nr:hypothetical protein CCUS01_11468 [Colletotrichum cuscutae]
MSVSGSRALMPAVRRSLAWICINRYRQEGRSIRLLVTDQGLGGRLSESPEPSDRNLRDDPPPDGTKSYGSEGLSTTAIPGGRKAYRKGGRKTTREQPIESFARVAVWRPVPPPLSNSSNVNNSRRIWYIQTRRSLDIAAAYAPQYCFSHKPRLPSYASPLNIGLMNRPSAAKETTFSAFEENKRKLVKNVTNEDNISCLVIRKKKYETMLTPKSLYPAKDLLILPRLTARYSTSSVVHTQLSLDRKLVSTAILYRLQAIFSGLEHGRLRQRKAIASVVHERGL